jgi:hypothetical protein
MGWGESASQPGPELSHTLHPARVGARTQPREQSLQSC